jgi:hypothetical protein
MSGTGGGYDIPSISPATNDCESLRIKTQLSSPISSVLSTLKVGDVLAISLATTVGPIQARTSSGVLAGSILSKEAQSLINCINQGHQYKAEIKALSGGSCEILISIVK